MLLWISVTSELYVYLHIPGPLNIKSLLNTTFVINNLNLILIANNIDRMFLTETWFSTDGQATLIEASPPNYNFTYSCRRDNSTHPLSTTCVLGHYFDEYKSFQYHAFVFSSPPIICVTLYRPPKQCSALISDFSESLSLINNNQEFLFLVILICMWITNQTLSLQDF